MKLEKPLFYMSVFLFILTVSWVVLMALSMGEYAGQVPVLLSQLVQAWDKSSIAFLNNYAYAILGISSISYGTTFLKNSLLDKLVGCALILSGLSSIIGAI